MKMKCSVESCTRPSHTRGWCKPHYDAWIRTGDPSSYRGDRSSLSLWERILETGWTRTMSGCLEWNGYRNGHGYGQIRYGGKKGKLYRVHREAYRNLVGPLTSRDQVLHICDNPACSEPSHLRKGRALENMRDMRAKRRGYKDLWNRCPNGHPYPADRPPGEHNNRCKICAAERNRRYLARRRELDPV